MKSSNFFLMILQLMQSNVIKVSQNNIKYIIIQFQNLFQHSKTHITTKIKFQTIMIITKAKVLASIKQILISILQVLRR